jgi:hypothetical protein
MFFLSITSSRTLICFKKSYVRELGEVLVNRLQEVCVQSESQCLNLRTRGGVLGKYLFCLGV